MTDHQHEQRPASQQGTEQKGIATDVVIPMIQNATDAGVAAGVALSSRARRIAANPRGRSLDTGPKDAVAEGARIRRRACDWRRTGWRLRTS
jgi:hypothetical protein